MFPYIKEKKIGLGYLNWEKSFITPDGVEQKFGNIFWYTTFPIAKHDDKLILYKHYTPEQYPKYDNYDAISVDKTCDIPADYNGLMGVPITFLDKYNPKQLEIIGLDKEMCGHRFILNKIPLYVRIVIKKIQ